MFNRLRLPFKRIRIVAMFLVILLGLILSSALASTQTVSPEEKTERLLSMFDEANATVLGVFQKLEASNIAIPPEALNEYNQAVSLKVEAETLCQEGNWLTASTELIGALQMLKRALWTIFVTAGGEPTQMEINLEKTVQLESSISRLKEQLRQLESLAMSAQAVGFDTSAAEGRIAVANSLLANASQNLGQGRLDQALNDVREAEVLIDDLTVRLSNLAAELSTQRFEAYIAETENRLAAIKQSATLTSNTASLTALNQAETSLNQAKTYLEKQLFNQTVTALVDSKQSEEAATDALKPSATSSSGTSVSNSPTAALQP